MSETTRVEIVKRYGGWMMIALRDRPVANAARVAPTVPPLSELTKRLRRSPEPGELAIQVIDPTLLKLSASVGEFWDTCIIDGPTVPTRIYEVDGQDDPVIVVPERYAAILDVVRELRLRAERGASPTDFPPLYAALLDRALPEDVIPALDALPLPHLISRITLFDGPHPINTWFSRAGSQPLAVVVDVDDLGHLTFYRRGRSDPIEPDLLHAWAHVVREKLPRDAEGMIWTLAEQFETSASVSRAFELIDMWYWLDGSDDGQATENWSVHLAEDVLHPDPERLGILAKEAPIRALALGRSLGATLERYRWPDGDARRRAVARAEQIEQLAAERALDLLSAIATGAKTDDSELLDDPAETAVQLLVFLKEGARLQGAAGPPSLRFRSMPPDPTYLEQLRGWTWLRHLALSYSVILHDTLRALPEIGGIETLTIRGRFENPSGLWMLPPMATLKRLDLSEAWCDRDRLRAHITLKTMPWLEHVTLRRQDVSEWDLEQFHDALPNTTIVLK